MRSSQNRLVGILVVFCSMLLNTATQAAPKLPEPEKAAAAAAEAEEEGSDAEGESAE